MDAPGRAGTVLVGFADFVFMGGVGIDLEETNGRTDFVLTGGVGMDFEEIMVRTGFTTDTV